MKVPLLNFFAETLKETIEDSGIPQKEIAVGTGIPAPHLSEMKNGRRRCTPEYDMRLSRYFGVKPGLWMGLQLDYEFRKAELEKGDIINREVQPHAA